VQQGERLDALINNAGIHLDLLSRWTSPTLSSDGHEIHWRTNYLGTFQLTQRMLPLLLNGAQDTGDARLVNVVSQLHHKGRNQDMFQAPSDYNSWLAYGTSKLALIHMTQTVHRLHHKHGLSACSLHPGAVYSQIASNGLAEAPTLSRLRNALAPLERGFMFNTLEGAQTSLFCATDPVAKAGGYYRRCRQAAPSASCGDSDVSQRLWDTTLSSEADGFC
jgi:retinol dehydrogenase-12/retinol dehydrogenase-13